MRTRWCHIWAAWWHIAWASLLLFGSACKGTSEGDEVAARLRVDEQGRVVLTEEERTAIGLETTSADQGSLTTSRLRFGKVVARPQEDALITAPITGRLVAPTVALGAIVSSRDVLITLEPLVDAASLASLEAQRRELQGQIEGARAQVVAKEVDLKRISNLVSSGLATEAERAQAEAALTAERARVESLRRASGELARITGGRLELRAPVPGVVATLATEAGSVVQQGTVVGRVVRAGPRWIDVAVPPEDPVGSDYRGQGVAGAVSARLVTPGVVIQPDGTRRDRLEAPETAAASLLPGATIPVEVLHDTKGVVVPVSAMVRRGDETLVFVDVGDGRYEAHPVEVAARDDNSAVISSGLLAGSRVVTRGASSLLGELGAQRNGEP